MNLIPMVVEQEAVEKGHTIFTRDYLRIASSLSGVRLTTMWPIWSSPSYCFFQLKMPEKDIHLYINSPGGSVTAGMGIYDTMQFIKPDVSTICVGMAASMGSLLVNSRSQR